MSTVVYQGLQSCLESQLLERTLRLKLAAPKSTEFDNNNVREPFHYEDKPSFTAQNHESGSRSFHQLLSSISSQHRSSNYSSYVHPLAARSSSPRLSDKSLELCTENLGSETGTDISEESIFSIDSSTSEITRSLLAAEPQSRRRVIPPATDSRKVIDRSRSFPPPLTTRRGSNALRVRPYRESGRLIIEAVECTSAHTSLHAERSGGRLKLCILRNNNNYNDNNNVNDDCNISSDVSRASNFDSGETAEENGEVVVKEEEKDLCENETTNEERGDYGEVQSDGEEEGEGVEGSGDVQRRKDMDGNSLDMDAEMGIEKFQNLSRCKEGGGHGDKGLCNWAKRLCVATS